MINLKYSPVTQSYFLLFGATIEKASVIARYATRLEAIADLEAKGLILDSRDKVHNAEEFLNELHNFE
jgi:hypothetical protein